MSVRSLYDYGGGGIPEEEELEPGEEASVNAVCVSFGYGHSLRVAAARQGWWGERGTAMQCLRYCQAMLPQSGMTALLDTFPYCVTMLSSEDDISTFMSAQVAMGMSSQSAADILSGFNRDRDLQPSSPDPASAGRFNKHRRRLSSVTVPASITPQLSWHGVSLYAVAKPAEKATNYKKPVANQRRLTMDNVWKHNPRRKDFAATTVPDGLLSDNVYTESLSRWASNTLQPQSAFLLTQVLVKNLPLPHALEHDRPAIQICRRARLLMLHSSMLCGSEGREGAQLLAERAMASHQLVLLNLTQWGWWWGQRQEQQSSMEPAEEFKEKRHPWETTPGVHWTQQIFPPSTRVAFLLETKHTILPLLPYVDVLVLHASACALLLRALLDIDEDYCETGPVACAARLSEWPPKASGRRPRTVVVLPASQWDPAPGPDPEPDPVPVVSVQGPESLAQALASRSPTQGLDRGGALLDYPSSNVASDETLGPLGINKARKRQQEQPQNRRPQEQYVEGSSHLEPPLQPIASPLPLQPSHSSRIRLARQVAAAGVGRGAGLVPSDGLQDISLGISGLGFDLERGVDLATVTLTSELGLGLDLDFGADTIGSVRYEDQDQDQSRDQDLMSVDSFASAASSPPPKSKRCPGSQAQFHTQTQTHTLSTHDTLSAAPSVALSSHSFGSASLSIMTDDSIGRAGSKAHVRAKAGLRIDKDGAGTGLGGGGWREATVGEGMGGSSPPAASPSPMRSPYDAQPQSKTQPQPVSREQSVLVGMLGQAFAVPNWPLFVTPSHTRTRTSASNGSASREPPSSDDIESMSLSLAAAARCTSGWADGGSQDQEAQDQDQKQSHSHSHRQRQLGPNKAGHPNGLFKRVRIIKGRTVLLPGPESVLGTGTGAGAGTGSLQGTIVLPPADSAETVHFGGSSLAFGPGSQTYQSHTQTQSAPALPPWTPDRLDKFVGSYAAMLLRSESLLDSHHRLVPVTAAETKLNFTPDFRALKSSSERAAYRSRYGMEMNGDPAPPVDRRAVERKYAEEARAARLAKKTGVAGGVGGELRGGSIYSVPESIHSHGHSQSHSHSHSTSQDSASLQRERHRAQLLATLPQPTNVPYLPPSTGAYSSGRRAVVECVRAGLWAAVSNDPQGEVLYGAGEEAESATFSPGKMWFV